jgi:hypothetical protein
LPRHLAATGGEERFRPKICVFFLGGIYLAVGLAVRAFDLRTDDLRIDDLDIDVS